MLALGTGSVMASDTDAWEEARREAGADRREEVREMTPGERMELAYHLFTLSRDDS